MKLIPLIFLFCLFSTTLTFGQIKIGDNPQNIDPSSVLELESNSRVLVITRVSSLEMEAIIPLRGGVVYNTDTQCLHYFNGTEWINLCDAVSFSLTNDPVINARSTISIVDNGTSINLEVAPNSIRSENIVDGGINGDDIQDNSIGESKLGADSVSANELRDNSVGGNEIIDGSIMPIDMANTIPNQVLTTDINGTVTWEDTSNLRGAVADEVSITGSGTVADPLTLADAISASILSNTTAITAHVSNDNDTDNQNEILTSAELDGNDLVLTESGVERRVDLSSLNNAGTDNQTLNLDVNSLEITNGNAVNLAKYLDNADEQQLTIAGNRISLTDGGFVDLPPGTVDTDEQQLTIAGNRISLTDGGFVDLPAGTVDTDNQNLTLDGTTLNITDGSGVDLNPLLVSAEDGVVTGVALNGTDLDFTGAGGGFNGSVSLAGLGGGTADGALTNVTLNGTDLEFTSSAGGFTGPVSLAGLGGGAGSTEEADGTTILGLGTPTDQFRVGSIGSTELTNGSVLLEDLNSNGANNGQVIKWDESANAGVGGWIVADDRTDGTGVPALTDGTILLGDGTDTPQERVVSGDATLDNTGVLTISEDAITLPKLAPGTVAGQLLQWNGTVWEFITEADINVTIVSDDADNSITTSAVDGGAFYDDSTKEDAANKSIDGTLTDNSDVDFPTEQAVKTYVDTQIGAISAQTVVSTDADNSITASAIDGGAFYDDSTKEDAANKSIDGTLTDNSDIDFPTEQAVKTYVDTQIGAIPVTIIVSADADNSITASAIDGGAFYDDSALSTTTAANSAAILVNTNDITDKEDAANKSTDVALGTSNDEFPTQNAVKTYVDTQITATADDDITSATLSAASLLTINEGTSFVDVSLADLEESADIATVQADVDSNETAANTAIANVQSDVDANETAANNAIALKENSANKSTDVTLADATNTLFPTEQAVKIYVDTQIGNLTIENNLSNSDLTLDADRTVGLVGNNLYFTGAGSIGIGTTNPESKFHVSGGQVRAASFSAGNGTVAYRFADDPNTGMYNSAADELAFNAGDERILLLKQSGANGLEIIAEGSLELTEQLFDETGNNGNEGDVLTATPTGTAWSSPQIIAMGKYNPSTTNNLNGATVTGSAGNYQVQLNTPIPSADYIIQLTVENTYTINFANQTSNTFDVIITKTDGSTILGSPLPQWFFTISDF